jgi:hypothetical protein
MAHSKEEGIRIKEEGRSSWLIVRKKEEGIRSKD